ncbi:hypothetical protein D3C76_1098980 [compost metagenome]
MGQGDGLLQGFVQACRFEVGLNKTNQIRSAGFHPVGFGIQRSRSDPHGFVRLVVALGIQRHLLLRHLEPGVFQPELGQQGVFHGVIEGLTQGLGGEVAGQPDAGIRIQPLAADGIYRFPLLVVAEHLIGRIRLGRKLQGQPAGGVGG